MECHQCGACCTEISISTKYAGHPDGKPAGIRCKWLDDTNKCVLFRSPDRPDICSAFQADMDICGTNKQEATQRIRWYEKQTQPE
jgi:hypothetical protein